jgi:hypothetical protein
MELRDYNPRIKNGTEERIDNWHHHQKERLSKSSLNLNYSRSCTALYAGLLEIEHSCVANSRIICLPATETADEFHIELYAVQDISRDVAITRNLDDSLLLEGTFVRRETLRDIYT